MQVERNPAQAARRGGNREHNHMKTHRATVVIAAILTATILAARAIEIADGFTYAGTNGYAASRALALDYANYPVFQAVGVLNIVAGTNEFTGTGTLLNNEWVLTAGHNWSASTVTSLQFIHLGATNEAVLASLTQHPLWTNAPSPLTSETVGPSQGWDVALFRLSAPISNSIVYPELYTKSDEFGKIGFTLGGGRLGTGTTPWVEQGVDPPLIYAAANIIDRTTSQTNSGYSGGFLVNDFDASTNASQNTLGLSYATNSSAWLWNNVADVITSLDPAGTITGTNSSASQYTNALGNILEGGTAPGDSGGPTFIQDGEAWKLAGITSWGVNPWDVLTNGSNGFRGLYGDVNYFTRVSQTRDWIVSVIPEPSTQALLILASLGTAGFCLRRRRC